MSDFDTGMVKIAISYKGEFFKDREAFLKQIGRLASVRGCLVQLYRLMLKMKKCEPIEALSEADKRELYNEAKRISEKQERNFLIEVCKAIHGFGQFIQEDENEFLKLCD